jgi:DNA-binding beta-propeller fold protein YncE
LDDFWLDTLYIRIYSTFYIIKYLYPPFFPASETSSVSGSSSATSAVKKIDLPRDPNPPKKQDSEQAHDDLEDTIAPGNELSLYKHKTKN